jgi:hypothetical protein
LIAVTLGRGNVVGKIFCKSRTIAIFPEGVTGKRKVVANYDKVVRTSRDDDGEGGHRWMLARRLMN